MLMFAIILGLSMDYDVFLISRVHETWHRLGDAHRSPFEDPVPDETDPEMTDPAPALPN